MQPHNARNDLLEGPNGNGVEEGTDLSMSLIRSDDWEGDIGISVSDCQHFL